MRIKQLLMVVLAMLIFFPLSEQAREVQLDISTCKMILDLFKEMKQGTAKEKIEKQLDSILATRPYKTMFKHYNRKWRRGHLPTDVFKRMVLSLRFPKTYKKGENKRADQMRPKWQKYYDDLSLFAQNVADLEAIDLKKLIDEAVQFAQTWLPPEMKIPGFYLAVHPNGGSTAFALKGSQGYDFFQLERQASGKIHVENFTRIISHESHHLGLNIPEHPIKNPKHKLAFQFLRVFVGEGTATKFVDNRDGGFVPPIDGKRKNSMNQEQLITRQWQAYHHDHKKIWLNFFLALEHSFTGEISAKQLNKELRDYWITGIIGRNYFIGSEIFGAIYHGLGKEACFDAMRDPRKMLPLYNQALYKNKEILGKCIRIPDSIIRISQSIGKE